MLHVLCIWFNCNIAFHKWELVKNKRKKIAYVPKTKAPTDTKQNQCAQSTKSSRRTQSGIKYHNRCKSERRRPSLLIQRADNLSDTSYLVTGYKVAKIGIQTDRQTNEHNKYSTIRLVTLKCCLQSQTSLNKSGRWKTNVDTQRDQQPIEASTAAGLLGSTTSIQGQEWFWLIMNCV